MSKLHLMSFCHRWQDQLQYLSFLVHRLCGYNLRLTEFMLFTYADYNFPMNKIVYVSSMILYDSWPIRVLNVLLIRRLLDVRTHWVIL